MQIKVIKSLTIGINKKSNVVNTSHIQFVVQIKELLDAFNMLIKIIFLVFLSR